MIKYPNGTSNSVEYDTEGKPSKIVNSEGYRWVREGDGWTEYKGNVKRGHNSYDVVETTGGDLVTTLKDGARMVTRLNGVMDVTPSTRTKAK